MSGLRALIDRLADLGAGGGAAVEASGVLGSLEAAGLTLGLRDGRLTVAARAGLLSGADREQLAHRRDDLRVAIAAASGGVEAPPGRLSDRFEPVPASFAQRRLWLAEQRGDAGSDYVVPIAMRLRGELDEAALVAALRGLLERHEALRTSFETRDGEPWQRVLPVDAVPQSAWFERIDLSGRADLVEREDGLDGLIAHQAASTFDLTRAPMLRVRLVALGPVEHALLLAFHHVAVDGASLAVLLTELSVLYRSARLALSDPLPAPSLQVIDLAVHERARMTADRQARLLDYWLPRLATLPVTAWPAEGPGTVPDRDEGRAGRLATDGAAGRGRALRFDVPVPELDAVCRATGATPFMVLLAALNVLLTRQLGQSHVAVGSPVENRSGLASEGVVGFFVNAVVMDVDLAAAEHFIEVVARTRESVLGAFAHQELPFDRLTEALQPQRDVARRPLFSIVFALQGGRPDEGAHGLEGLRVEPLGEPPEMALRFELELHVRLAGERLVGLIAYDPRRHGPGAMRQLQVRYTELLRHLLAAPQRSLTAIPWPLPGDRAWLESVCGRMAPRWPHRTLPEALDEAAVRHAARLAVSDATGSWTYSELFSRGAALARGLAARGLGRGDVVALSFGGQREDLALLLGALRAGIGYLPLDPSLPAARQLDLVRRCGVTAWVGRDVPRPPGLGGTDAGCASGPVAIHRVEGLADARSDDGRGDAAEEGGPAGPDDLAYVIFTSGSSGEPKGVEVPHRGLANTVFAQREAFGLQPDDRVLQFASIGFDASISEIATTLLAGASLHLCGRDRPSGGAELEQAIRDRGITLITLPPAVLRTLSPQAVPDLRTVVSAGSACSDALVRAWAPGRRFINAYGPTEVSICATLGVQTAGLPPDIGVPLRGVRVRVVSPLDGIDCVQGQAGELWVGGAGLARGYRGRPDLDAGRFVTDAAGMRWYRTGDRVRWLSNGRLAFEGRIDEQLEWNGVRIEPAEVEAALRSLPGVRDAAVAVRAGSGDEDGTLVASVVPEPPESELELWPSIAEFFVYDALLYHALAADRRRDAQYVGALRAAVRDKVVLDVGTGGEAILARRCIEAGARRVYAVELLPESFRMAREAIERAGMTDRITLLLGDARTLELPEPIDVCVSEIVGALGGSEGAAAILEAVRRGAAARHPHGLAPTMIPARSHTRIAAVELPQSLLDDPRMGALPAHYAQRVFDTEGGRFDLRICVRGLGIDHLASTVGTFEDLDFAAGAAERGRHANRLAVTRPSRLSGLAAWLTVELDARHGFDVMEGGFTWLPVFFPVFDPPLEVVPGDVIDVEVERRPCANGLNPDYRLSGVVEHADGRTTRFEHLSPHRPAGTGGTAFHARLFAGDAIPIAPAVPGPAIWRETLARQLPATLVPARFVAVPRLPLTAAGKVDRPALAAATAADDAAATLGVALAELGDPFGAATLIRRPGAAAVLVTPPATAPGERDILDGWRTLYESLHDDARMASDVFHGWVSSYDGAPIGIEAMQEWLGCTLDALRPWARGHVLELGCGNGQIALGLLDRCERYVATDVSAPALAHLSARRDRGVAGGQRLELVQGDAWAAASSIEPPPGGWDLVILNSVVQYFPSGAYLRRLLALVAQQLSERGVIFLGDLRDPALALELHVRLARAGAPELSPEAARAAAWRGLEREAELLVAPEALGGLAGLCPPEVRLKPGRQPSELRDFRYDALLRRVRDARPVCRPLPPLDLATPDARFGADWRDRLESAIAAAERLAADSMRPSDVSGAAWALPVRGLENARTDARASGAAGVRVDPGEVLEWAARRGVAVELRAAAGDGRAMTAVLRPVDSAPCGWDAVSGETDGACVAGPGGFREPVRTQAHAAPDRRARGAPESGPSGSDAMDPGCGDRALASRLERRLVQLELRVPVHLVERLPHRPDGTLDEAESWRLLERAGRVDADPGGAPGSPPTDPTESALGRLWCDLLGIAPPGPLDDFFALGGHSLMATRLVSRIEQRFGVCLPVREVFDAPTLAGLAARVRAQRPGSGNSPGEPLPSHPPGTPVPMSAAQARLHFLAELVPDDPFYNIPIVLGLRGVSDTDADRIEAALRRVARRHDVLRARLCAPSGPVTEIGSRAAPPRWIEARADDARGTLERIEVTGDLPGSVRALVSQPIPLDGDRLWRAALMRRAPGLPSAGEGEPAAALAIVLHHLIADGWSAGLLLSEIAEALGRADGEAEPPLPRPYADFCAWQREPSQVERMSASVAHWAGQLAGVPALELPTDRPRPPVQTFVGASVPLRIPGRTAASLRGLARAHGCTPFMLWLALFQTLLHRYTRQVDFAVAVPVAGRGQREFERTLGLFVNTVAHRARPAGGQGFGDLLAQVRDGVLAGLPHEDAPFERVIEALGPERDLSRNPVAQVLFALQNAPVPVRSLPGFDLVPMPVANEATRFDLELSVWDAEDGSLQGYLTYGTALLEPSSADAIARAFETLAEGVAADVSLPLRALPLLGRDASARVLERGRRRATLEVTETLADRFVRVAAAHAARAAAGCPKVAAGAGASDIEWCTYGALLQRADEVAAALERAGAGPGHFVGLLAERDLDAIVGLVGIVLSGAAYVPWDPATPDERIRFMAGDAGVSAVVASPRLGDRAQRIVGPSGPALVVVSDAAPGAPSPRAAGPRRPPGRRVRPQDPAYVIYTSGSTGQPKGVVVEHRQVMRLFDSVSTEMPLDASQVWTLFHSLAFDFSVWELWGALLHGGRLLLVPDAIRRAPDAFHALIARAGVTVLSQTPSAFRQFAAADASAAVAGGAGWALRHVIFGGEALDFAGLADWFERHPPGEPELVNLYGITETTVHVTWRPVRAEDTATGRGSLIGEALRDLDLHLLDETGQPVPDGFVGEICVGGAGLARGYLNRPALTAERFVPDTTNGERLYRSGDLGRRVPGGDIQYLGRADAQFKLRGHRIEAGEIVAAIGMHRGIREAAVGVRGDQLVAWVVPPEQALDPRALVASLTARMPAYMVPRRWVGLERLPLTSSGKLDTRALPDPALVPPAAGRRREDGGNTAPENELERGIAALWGDLLALAEVDPDANFFDLGGHSLMATAVRRGLRERLGVDVPMVAIFQHPTVRQLARHLAGSDPKPGPDEPVDRGDARRDARARLAGRRRRRDEGPGT